jgi:hypothetical protein
MSDAAPIWIVDEVTTRPGQGPAFLAAYMERYVPKAQARGMTLAHRMVEPAMWLDDAPNRLLFVWTLPHPGAVWASKFAARPDPDVATWWNEEAPAFIESRRRSTLADADMLAEYDNV